MDKKRKIKKILLCSLGVSSIAISSGIVFGLTSAFAGAIKYIDLKPYSDSKEYVEYESAALMQTQWISDESVPEPVDESTITDAINTCKVNNPDEFVKDINKTYDYCEEILDSSAHAVKDKSFNQNVYLGTTNWVHQTDPEVSWNVGDDIKIKMDDLENDDRPVEVGVYSSKVKKPTSDDNNGFVNTYKAGVSDNCKSLVLPGFAHIAPLLSFKNSEKNLFSQAGYILIDGTIPSANIASVYFRCDQCAFLTGLAACQYLEDNYEKIYSKVNNGKLAVGVFGGLPAASVTVYMGGFEWGVWAYNNYVLPKLKAKNNWDETTTNKHKVDVIKSGVSTSYFSGSFVTGDARPIVQQLLADGADLILPVAAPQINDVISEIINQKSPSVIVGVDTDQENSDLGQKTSTSPLNYGEKIIKFSAQKDMAYVTSMILQASVYGYRGFYIDQTDKKWKPVLYDGQPLGDRAKYTIGTYGYGTTANIENNCVRISEAGHPYLNKVISYISGTEITDYQESINYLKNTKLYDHGDTGSANETLFEVIEKNMKFYY